MDPASTVVLSFLLFTILLPRLIYFALSRPPFLLAISFVQCVGCLFSSPRIFLFCLFSSFLCIVSDLDLFLSKPSLMTIFTPALCAVILLNMVRSCMQFQLPRCAHTPC